MKEKDKGKCKTRLSRLHKVGDKEEVQRLQQLVASKVEFVNNKNKTTLEKKFKNLIEKQKGEVEGKSKQTVVNLSKRELSETEQKVLEHGLNFSIASCKTPKFEIIKLIETAAVKLTPEKAECYREQKSRLRLKNAKGSEQI
jgi:hypothetical protein